MGRDASPRLGHRDWTQSEDKTTSDIMLKKYLLFPHKCSMLSGTHYSENYASIIRPTLAQTQKTLSNLSLVPRPSQRARGEGRPGKSESRANDVTGRVEEWHIHGKTASKRDALPTFLGFRKPLYSS